MRTRLAVVLSSVVALVVMVGPTVTPVGAIDSTSQTVAARAVASLRPLQLDDGGFDAAFEFDGTVFPATDFATSEAVLAIAESAQTSSGWSTDEALAAVRSFTRRGRSPLDFIDAQTSSTMPPGRAAKFIVLVAAPLGLDARAFDAAGNGGPIDLVARMESARRPDGSYGAGAINVTLLAMIANQLLGRPVAASTVAYVKGAQQANGAWSFTGEPTGTDTDVDTTARAVQALVAGGLSPDDPSIRRALRFFVSQRGVDGGFGAVDEFSDRIASSALAAIAIDAAGFAPASSCWIRVSSPAPTANYRSPDSFIQAQVKGDGGFPSPFAPAYTTAQAVQGLLRHFQPTISATSQCPALTQHILTRGGTVFSASTAAGFGPDVTNTIGALTTNAVALLSSDANQTQTWIVGSDGGVFARGSTPFFGSAGALRLRSPIVGGAATRTGLGYWLFAADGGVFAYGDARFVGSAGALPLQAPIVGGAATPSNNGYWLFGADGGVFAYGDARFFGSAGGIKLRSPIVGGAATLNGDGYWLAAADGGVFAFGGAEFSGSAAGLRLASPVAAMAISPSGASTGSGYWLLTSDGGVFTFGGAPFFGSATSQVAAALGVTVTNSVGVSIAVSGGR